MAENRTSPLYLARSLQTAEVLRNCLFHLRNATFFVAQSLYDLVGGYACKTGCFAASEMNRHCFRRNGRFRDLIKVEKDFPIFAFQTDKP
jgi:hypothetical protein